MKLGIATVLIAQEHLPLIRKWCQYHIDLGWNNITIYNNSGSITSSRETSYFRSGKFQKSKCSKNGIPYPKNSSILSDEESHIELQKTLEDLPVNVIRWTPELNGIPTHGQVEAYIDFIKTNKDKIDWAAFIDADEYLYSSHGCEWEQIINLAESGNISRLMLSGINYEHRVRINGEIEPDLSKLRCCKLQKQGYKNICKLSEVVKADIHWQWEFKNNNEFLSLDVSQFRFNHYNSPSFSYNFEENKEPRLCKIKEGISL